jgi:hypothetical protein
MNNVLVTLHWMVGSDLHEEPGPPGSVPPVIPLYPHLTTAPLYLAMLPSMAQSVQCCFRCFSTMQRGTDIQSGIPHLTVPPYNLLMALYTTFSASKSHFGVASVLVENKAIATAHDGFININLNCGDIPTTTGFVIAPNTVVSSMTNADYLGGLFSMFFDCIVQAAMSRMMGGWGVNSWEEGILWLFVGTPLGFGFNTTGTGIIGYIGRVHSAMSDVLRADAEALAGDSKQALASVSAALKSLEDAVTSFVGPTFAFSPILDVLAGWDVGHDADVVLARPEQGLDYVRSWFSSPGSGASPTDAPSTSSQAIDNPNAEQF